MPCRMHKCLTSAWQQGHLSASQRSLCGELTTQPALPVCLKHPSITQTQAVRLEKLSMIAHICWNLLWCWTVTQTYQACIWTM